MNGNSNGATQANSNINWADGDVMSAGEADIDRDIATRKSVAEAPSRYWVNVLLRVAALLALVYCIWRVRGVAGIFIGSLVLACFADAAVTPLCRRRWGTMKAHTQRLLATSIVFIALIGVVVGTVAAVVSPIRQESNNLRKNWPKYQAILSVKFAQLRDWYDTLPPELHDFVDERRAAQQSTPSTGGDWTQGIMNSLLHGASRFFEYILVPIIAFYVTLDARRLRNEFLFFAPRSWYRPGIAFMSQTVLIMRAYIGAQIWLAVIAAVIIGAFLRIVGMNYVILLGVFAGATRIIPVVGGFISGIPIVILAFAFGMQHGNPTLWVTVAIFITCLNIFEGKVLLPKFLGHNLDMHPAIVLVALLIGGEFFGLMGMFLAAPVAALIRVLLVHNTLTRRRRNRVGLVGNAGGDAPAEPKVWRLAYLPRAHGNGHKNGHGHRNGNGTTNGQMQESVLIGETFTETEAFAIAQNTTYTGIAIDGGRDTQTHTDLIETVAVPVANSDK